MQNLKESSKSVKQIDFKNMNPERFVFWLEKNLKAVLLAFVFGLFLVGGWVAHNWWEQKQEIKISKSLYQFQKDLQLLAEKPKGDSLKDLEKKDEKLIWTEELRSKTSAYERAVREKPKSRIAVRFAIDLADFYYRHQKKQKAKNLLSLFALAGKSSSLYHLASFQLATYYINDRDCQKALPVLKTLSANEKAQTFHAESALQQGICLEFLNQGHLALEQYDKLINEYPEDYISRLAKNYKNLLILNKKLKGKK